MDDSKEDAWIQTFTGKKFYPLDPDGSEYCLDDIAHALSNICRFTGHCKFYSVAQHSVILSEIVIPKNAMWALMHDASEAYLTDIARPLKHLPEFEQYRILEKRTMIAICKVFGLPVAEPAEVKELDSFLLRNEAKCLGMLQPDWQHFSLPDLEIFIKPQMPNDAEESFHKRYKAIWKAMQ